MLRICFYFQVHQPWRLRTYNVFDIGRQSDYFDDAKNREIIDKVSNKCYMPMNQLLLDLIDRHDGQFKVAFSITGTAIEQLAAYRPDVLESFRALADTGCVEFLAETYHHSLAFVHDLAEFDIQVDQHIEAIEKYFGARPTVFRNTELVFNNDLARHIEARGFKALLAEGADQVLGWRSPNFVYRAASTRGLKLLLKNYRLSDDIAFRFSDRGWSEHPLLATKFTRWINEIHGNGDVLNLFMDYETFGEHQWSDSGIFDFMSHLPEELLKHPDNVFVTPGEAVDACDPVEVLDVPQFVSWADAERDLTAWLGNAMQQSASVSLHEMGPSVRKTCDAKLIQDWQRLTTSDHFYYMCTKWFADGDVHKYFNPFESPYEAYIAFVNTLADLRQRVERQTA